MDAICGVNLAFLAHRNYDLERESRRQPILKKEMRSKSSSTLERSSKIEVSFKKDPTRIRCSRMYIFIYVR